MLVVVCKMRWRTLRTGGSSQSSTERLAHTSTLCGHLVFVHGGIHGEDSLAEADFVYNTMTRRWKTLDLALQLYNHSATLIDDKLLIIASNETKGSNGNRTRDLRPRIPTFTIDLQNLEVEDLCTYSSLGSSLPPLLIAHMAGYFEAKREIVIIGRCRERDMPAGRANSPLDHFALDVETMIWRKLVTRGKAPSEYKGAATCVCAANKTLYAFISPYDDFEVAELYVMNYQTHAPVWSLLKAHGNAPLEMTSSSIDLIPGSQLLLFGDEQEEESDIVYKFDIATAVWSKGSFRNSGSLLGPNEFEMRGRFEARSLHTSVSTGEKLLYFGGIGLIEEEPIPLNRVLELDLRQLP